jgi:integrase
MFKWAKQPGRKFVTVNPFADLPAPGGAIVKRDRFLTADEVVQVWRALETPEQFGVSRDAATALRLILVTSARPGMVAGMVGAELRDLRGPSEHGPHWSLPAERMKAGSAFITPLSPLALDLLRPHLKADPTAPVFDLYRHDLQEAARRIVAGLGMARWTPHDLRRTAATILRPGRLFARTDRRAAGAYAKGRHGGLCPVGQVRPSA